MPLHSVHSLIEAGRRKPNNWVTEVAQFHREKLSAVQKLASGPTLRPAEEVVYMMASLQSELAELSEGFATKDLVEVADGIVDSIYVLIGIGLAVGLPLEAIFIDVHRSNMDKLPAAPGTMGRKARTADGTLISMKPEGWVGPRIEEILRTVWRPQL